MFKVAKPITVVGVVLILVVGFIHFVAAPDSFNDATYKGLLFVANGVGAIVAAIGIWRGAKWWGWGLGLLIALTTLAGYVLSRTVGLPGLDPESDNWFEPMGVASVVAEGLFLIIGLFYLATAPKKSPAKAVEEEREIAKVA